MKKISVTDLKAESSSIGKETVKAISKIVSDADYILGEETKKFEENFASYCGSKYAVGVASGTAAIFLSLIAAGIGEGDEVITSCISAGPTVEAIKMSGAKPHFVDINSDNLSIDADKIEAAINKKTKAIMPVYLYGFPSEVDKINKICKKYNLLLIADCAQAHGALYKTKKVGSQEFIACFSFMPTKNLGAYGDAGCVVTNNKFIYEKIKMLKNHGRGDNKYKHEIMGYPERMDNLQATVLNVKLKYLDKWNMTRRKIAKRYFLNFEGKDWIKTLKPFKNTDPCYHQFVIIVENRDALRSKLRESNVDTGMHFPIPLHLQPAFNESKYNIGDFPVSELLTGKILSLPMHPFLSEKEVDFVSELVIKYTKKQHEKRKKYKFKKIYRKGRAFWFYDI